MDSSSASEMESGFYDPNAICPHIIRLGVCLEPMACSIKHSIYNTQVADFVPNFDAPEFNPSQEE